ncbi:surface-associated interspersed protein (SURFIN) [Plasmodium gallinaceum]|uniref:Surface-associated interspersed protein (SURFIN) n=1 Tax=Plasmodium gallinaceum TaxID=5849 RepID=A0A1J1GXV5_PLAGA|nr:surface-associated interspersed protein (SURFIN) [Plasmodium gallinaceum]CRG97394.1 surface-associated interspersed protein (SURFIN) [Plasmodium gallinaceum]
MKKNSTSKNARLLTELEEISCMLNQKNATIENNNNLSNDTIKLNTEIKSFMDDTRNELQFYLEDNNIKNDTEKCQKASSYINWRGMDYVNLLLSEKEDYNISCLVEKWNKKKGSFEKSIDEEINSTCNVTTFDYCAILNKNENCTRPYEYNDLSVSPLLTYDQLNNATYSTNKTQIIEDRRLSFLNITNDMSYYHFRVYEKDRSERNCGKWSMYIYKRGKQFVNMAENELYDDHLYINDSIRIWNAHSNTLQNTELEDTGIQCNMTTLIHQIKERQNTADPYNLDWLSSNSTQNKSNETLNNTTTLPDVLQPTTVTPKELLNATTTNLSDNNTTIVNNVNNVNSSENTLTNVTSVPPVTEDQIDPKTSTTSSPVDSTQSNSLTLKKTMHSITNNISNTTSSSHSPKVVTSPTTETLPSNSTTSSGTPSVTPLPGEISATTAIDYSNTTMKSFTNNTAPSTTITPPLTTASLPPESAISVKKIIPTNSTESPTIDSSPTTMTTTPSHSSPPSLPSSTPTITILPSTNNSVSPTDNTEQPTSTIDSSISGKKSSSIHKPADSISNMESSTSNTTHSAATSSFSTEIKPSATTSSISSKNISVINHDSPTDDMNTSKINYESINTTEASTITPKPSMPTIVYPTTVTESFKDGSILPTTVDTNITTTSPLTDSSTPFSINGIENSTTTIEPSTNRVASPETDVISPAINTTSLMSDITSPTPLLYSPDNTSILTNTTAIVPITNNNLPSNQTDIIQTQNQQNIHAPLKQIQQHVNVRNCTENTLPCPNATVPYTLTPTKSSDPIEVPPTVTPKGDLLIPMVSGGIFLLGIIFFLILLCKYTPIGSWIRNRKSKKKKARKKIKKITREPLLMDTNNTKNESINRENYSFLHHEKEIPLCDMSLKNRKDLKYKEVKKSKAHKGMHMENEKDLKYKQVKKSKEHDGMYMENEKDLKYEQLKKFKEHDGMYMENEKDLKHEQIKKFKSHEVTYVENEDDLKFEQMKESKANEGMYMENEKDLKYEQIKKFKSHEVTYVENEDDLKFEQMKESKANEGMYMENEIDLKYEEMKKSKAHEGIYMENENKCIREVVDISKKHENESILVEKLYPDDPRNEIEEIELNVNKSRNEIKDELNKNILEKDPVHIVWHISNGTLNEEKANEINSQKEKSTCENEMKNLENKRSLNDEVCSWNTWINIHLIALLEYKKEEWKLNKTEFFNICLEEIKKDGENSNLKDMGNNFVMKIKEENTTDTIDKNSSILDKYKNEEWFINLKKEWEQEQEKHLQYLEGHEIKKMSELGLNNFILGKKKNIWKKWIEWKIEHSHKYKNQNWFIKLLEEYEKEDIHENIKEEKIENKGNNGIDECEMKKNLESRILLDIYMMVLEECTKEEWEKEEEFFKANMEEIKKYKNLEEKTNILDKIESERSWNFISEKKKEQIEKWKREKWFIELMLEWKNNEEKYMMETNKEILVKKNKERIINVILEKKRNIWKKHCENIYRKWKEDDNNEEWFTKLVNIYENEQNEYKNRIYKNSIGKKKENVKNIERCEPATEFNKKGEEKMRKYERNCLEESYEKNNSIINKKKLKWKTLIEIYMVIFEEYRKEEWLLNRGKFLEICLEEFIEEEKEKYPKKIENDLEMMREGEEDISTLMIEKQKILWKKWVKRNKRMSEKWKNEEWFINLKKEWEKEQENFDELTKESEISDIKAGKNPMLEKQKRIWKQWIKKQRMWFIQHSEEEWFNDILEDYEKEQECMKGITKEDTKKAKEIHENIKEFKQERDEEIKKYKKKEKLMQKVLIEIHMTLLEECLKDEWQKEKEYFFKTMMEELKIQENLDEHVIILEIKKKRSRNAILDIEKVEIEKWKKKKWFIELMLEMNNKEKKYIKDIYEDMIAKRNEDGIKNPMLEMQKIIWKKHCEDIHRKWIEKNNKEILQH